MSYFFIVRLKLIKIGDEKYGKENCTDYRSEQRDWVSEAVFMNLKTLDNYRYKSKSYEVFGRKKA